MRDIKDNKAEWLDNKISLYIESGMTKYEAEQYYAEQCCCELFDMIYGDDTLMDVFNRLKCR